MPDKKLLAILLSAFLLLSPFLQWWYLYSTLGAIFYSIFAVVVFIKLINTHSTRATFLWAVLLAYIMSCFALILYPPFQIACAIGAITFATGYVLKKQQAGDLKNKKITFFALAGAALISLSVVVGFVLTRTDAIKTITNTAYPGKRFQQSGGFNATHLFTGHLGAPLQFDDRAEKYTLPNKDSANQSESSNFIFLFPLLLLPSIYLVYLHHKKYKTVDWPLLLVNVALLLLLAWMLTPYLAPLSKLLLLERVPHARLLIGLALLGLFQLALFVLRYQNFKDYKFPLLWTVVYCLVAFLALFKLGSEIMSLTPGYIGLYRVAAYSLALSIIVYLLLRKRAELAALVMFLCTFSMVYQIHPLYRGTAIIREEPLSKAIQQAETRDEGYWATENFLLENFAAINGRESLSGLYAYPQLALWKSNNLPTEEAYYNRYAHTNFAFDRDPMITKTQLVLRSGDSFGIITEPCGKFLSEKGVSFLLTSSELRKFDTCVKLIKSIKYPTQTFYIYKLNN